MKSFTIKQATYPTRPLLSREAAVAILAQYEAAITSTLDGLEKEDFEDNEQLKHLNAVRGFLRGSQGRLLRGHDPEVVLDYQIIRKVSERDVVALVRTGMTTGFNRPLRTVGWGWQVVGDELKWLPLDEWDHAYEMQVGDPWTF